jgi:hypothetical protein
MTDRCRLSLVLFALAVGCSSSSSRGIDRRHRVDRWKPRHGVLARRRRERDSWRLWLQQLRGDVGAVSAEPAWRSSRSHAIDFGRAAVKSSRASVGDTVRETEGRAEAVAGGAGRTRRRYLLAEGRAAPGIIGVPPEDRQAHGARWTRHAAARGTTGVRRHASRSRTRDAAGAGRVRGGIRWELVVRGGIARVQARGMFRSVAGSIPCSAPEDGERCTEFHDGPDREAVERCAHLLGLAKQEVSRLPEERGPDAVRPQATSIQPPIGRRRTQARFETALGLGLHRRAECADRDPTARDAGRTFSSAAPGFVARTRLARRGSSPAPPPARTWRGPP